MRLSTFSRFVTGIAVVSLAAAGCGKASRTGRAPVYLVIDKIEAASGAKPDEVGSILQSDVLTFVKQTVNGQQVKVPTVFSDVGTVTAHISMKDIGPDGSAAPTSNNAVTITRYHVQYRRTDGRNTPGVDVPYPFDGAFTMTVKDSTGSASGFELVRIQAKEEAPLKALVNGGGALAISTIADITFYGKDQVGNDVQANASISVDFADWGDPE